jgi:DmsE family decaheme c-type cytochrome
VKNRTEGELDAVDLVSFGQKSKLSSKQQSAQCLACHQRDHSDWQGGKHHQNGVSCTDCHSVHGAEARPAPEMEVTTCGKCHRDKARAAEKVSHHPVREGRMKCTDCHNPHGTGREANLRTASVNDLCYACHTEKRGPHLWEHPPVVENCTTCHEPHGSIHNSLLVGNLPYLCQKCHSDARHPGTLYDGRGLFTGSSPSSRMFGQSCLNCHSRIHGSNHPSGHTFLR